jgi:hypothetical protein
VASSSFSGKFAEPMTTELVLPPGDSGLELLVLLALALALLLDELELLEHAATAARVMAAMAAIPPVAVLVRIWFSFRMGFPYSVLPSLA